MTFWSIDALPNRTTMYCLLLRRPMTSIQEDQERQQKLEELYAKDGRHDPSHPMHCLYTGLWQEYLLQCEGV